MHLFVGLVALVDGVAVDDVPVTVGQNTPKVIGTFSGKRKLKSAGATHPRETFSDYIHEREEATTHPRKLREPELLQL